VPEIVSIATSELGNRSYVVTDGSSAVVIDPPRDIDRVTEVLEERRLLLTHVLESHVHNDYVTGGLELSRRTGADYVLAAAEDVTFDRLPIRDGEEMASGRMRFRALHTPGHTPEHLSYVLFDDTQPVAVFTGGSLLYGTVGRTDLVDERLTERLTRAQFRSVRRLAAQLPADVAVYPTHGFGSFCASTTSTEADASTIGDERRGNIGLTTENEDAFVAEVTGGLGAYPRYYAHMGTINRAGPPRLDLSPPQELPPDEIRQRIDAGEWVVDVRDRTAFAERHLAGTVNVELADQLATYVGWTMPWGVPITLAGDSADQVARAQRMLARIGIDRPAGQATGGPAQFTATGDIRTYEVGDFPALAKALDNGGAQVLDVRRDEEYNDGHIRGAQHIPLPDVESRLREIPDDVTSWVHCASGYRAAIATSLLDRAGKPVVLVNDDWDVAADAGLAITS
jgi:glyoxylase-like metal-dependent hydrolase (beta-lactamase superfamily II)/rhodanese-related sulfurtransferase